MHKGLDVLIKYKETSTKEISISRCQSLMVSYNAKSYDLCFSFYIKCCSNT